MAVVADFCAGHAPYLADWVGVPPARYSGDSLCIGDRWVVADAPPIIGRSSCMTTPLSNHERKQGSSVRTYTPKPGDVQRAWHVIDATDVVLGRLASQAATLLRGKHKPTFAPHVDTGDFVIIINADKVALTGSKLEQKKAYRHSGYPGGLRATSYTQLMASAPEKAVEKAIRGMLPKNSLARQQLSKLKVYAGSTHPHQAQKPVPFEISQVAQ
ncbi:hypothetical protein KEM60_02067 [Austwickia sp. TVS 96-490-7B]|nr:hypothetical protein [Austwickia sp. TVS 96-490-7B]